MLKQIYDTFYQKYFSVFGGTQNKLKLFSATFLLISAKLCFTKILLVNLISNQMLRVWSMYLKLHSQPPSYLLFLTIQNCTMYNFAKSIITFADKISYFLKLFSCILHISLQIKLHPFSFLTDLFSGIKNPKAGNAADAIKSFNFDYSYWSKEVSHVRFVYLENSDSRMLRNTGKERRIIE